jgi:hypothetical protein
MQFFVKAFSEDEFQSMYNDVRLDERPAIALEALPYKLVVE